MSDTSASNVAFVRDAQIPPSPPPPSQRGGIKWLRENLFSSVTNSILTVLGLVAIYFILSGIIPWLTGSVWNASSLNECRELGEGACFAVINERFNQFMFGFYPADQYWRPVLTFVLMLGALAPVLFPTLPKRVLWLTVFFPVIAYFLLFGGSIWGPLMVVASFAIAGLIVMRGPAYVGSLGAILLGGLALVLLLLFAVSRVDGVITRVIADLSMEGYAEDLAEQIETAAPEDRPALVRLAENIEALPGRRDERAALTAELGDLRDAVPEALRDIGELSRVAPDAATPDERAALERYLDANTRLVALDTLIWSTESRVGLVGLERVPSSDFGGFTLVLIIGITGIAASLPIGILLALGRQSKLFVLRAICVGFIEFIRGVPLITLLFVASTLLNYFLPPGTEFDLLLRVLILVVLFSSAYMAEVVRGGLAALPKGQYEAGDALGLDYWKSMRLIVLPQALKISIPGIVNSFIGLFKDTVLVSVIGLLDPLKGIPEAVRGSSAWQGVYWEFFAFVGLFFFVFCYGMSIYSQYLERKLKTDHR
ncbi:MAG: amino acid ABC transporter permease [Pseudomonadota bacterium]